ncbi:MAG: hypothetical protein WB566_11240 [Terriglobales bacterium]
MLAPNKHTKPQYPKLNAHRSVQHHALVIAFLPRREESQFHRIPHDKEAERRYWQPYKHANYTAHRGPSHENSTRKPLGIPVNCFNR